MAKEIGHAPSTVHRIWRAFGLQPHRVESFKLSSDPLFVEKVRDIVGLYLSPPAHAVVLCVDEKSQVQALDRTQPLLPMRPGQAERRTHDYKRNGTTSLFAALDVKAGTIVGKCMARHRATEFRKFLDEVNQRGVEAQVKFPPARSNRVGLPGDSLAGPSLFQSKRPPGGGLLGCGGGWGLGQSRAASGASHTASSSSRCRAVRTSASPLAYPYMRLAAMPRLARADCRCTRRDDPPQGLPAARGRRPRSLCDGNHIRKCFSRPRIPSHG